MEVVNARAALLSNYEVLQMLREQAAERSAAREAALATKREDPTVKPKLDEVCENLRTVEYEAIHFLEAKFQPTKKQTHDGISTLVSGLGKYSLTKGEKLQIVNLAPTEDIELYVVVEQLEERFLDDMPNILQLVRDSFDKDAVAVERTQREEATDAEVAALAMEIDGPDADGEYDDDSWPGDDRWANDAEEYGDSGFVEEGGLEGDLDVEEE
ncbi:RNA polymerase Rpb4-domain-containing protein [Auriculariales sp. MPI-PUGE-AT-0066]|nr:RNA polymerase Rpb4-domain-containing protein [Auriculariales sp. MPI-PUGE-AT-0066]